MSPQSRYALKNKNHPKGQLEPGRNFIYRERPPSEAEGRSGSESEGLFLKGSKASGLWFSVSASLPSKARRRFCRTLAGVNSARPKPAVRCVLLLVGLRWDFVVAFRWCKELFQTSHREEKSTRPCENP